MTTETTTQEPRTLDVLLSLDTYQGMTDEEIQTIIDYEKEMAYGRGTIDTDAMSREQSRLQMINDNRNMLASMQVMIQSLVGYQPEMLGVPDGEA